MSFHVGEDLGDYTIIGMLGAGSVARVYQVEHRLTKRKEALKVLCAELPTPIQLQRFEREIAVQARLTHPNIATVHNAFQWKGCLVLVTEFLEGHTLEKLLSQGRLSVETGVEYVRQTLSALAYAHERGVVHRDVTPANLVVTPGGQVKLMDFGVSKSFGDIQLTTFGDIVGSLNYMAPEQARGSSQADPRSDLVAVGAILYDILTGRTPLGEQRKFAAIVTASEGAPPPPTDFDSLLSPRWNEVIRKALMRDRGQRYASAPEFLRAIDRLARATGIMPTPWSTKAPLFWIAAAGLAATALPVVINPKAFSQVPPPRAVSFHIAPPDIPNRMPEMAETQTNAAAIPIQKSPAQRITTTPRLLNQPVARRTMPVKVIPSSQPVTASPPITRADPKSEPMQASGVVQPLQPTPTASMAPQPELSTTELEHSPPEQPGAVEPAANETKRTAKNHFWSKLNPFRKKAQNSSEAPAFGVR